jgi:hypothetical protein
MLESQAALALGAELTVHPIGLRLNVNLPQTSLTVAGNGELIEPPRTPRSPREMRGINGCP